MANQGGELPAEVLITRCTPTSKHKQATAATTSSTTSSTRHAR
jgi:hypothetical protein